MSNEQKLREALRELMSIVSIHQKATRNNFAWAEMDFAREALATTEPAVNQQLTTEPFDEREAFEREMKKRLTSPLSFDRHEANTNAYAYLTTAVAWSAWQARAAMAQVGDINVVESFADDTKDALMAGRAYAQEALIRFDDAYDRHPSTEPERNAILADIQLIDAAMAKGVK